MSTVTTLTTHQINLVRLMGELAPMLEKATEEADTNMIKARLYEVKALLELPDLGGVPVEVFEAMGPTARQATIDIMVSVMLAAI